MEKIAQGKMRPTVKKFQKSAQPLTKNRPNGDQSILTDREPKSEQILAGSDEFGSVGDSDAVDVVVEGADDVEQLRRGEAEILLLDDERLERHLELLRVPKTHLSSVSKTQ